MQKNRPFLTALLGLTLWVQGFAIAAAPVATAVPAAGTASDAAALEMPCHGDAAASMPACDCCDGGCDNMTGCAVGSFVAAPASAMQPEAPPYIVVAARPWSPQTAVPPLPLRPPIVTHA